MPARCSGSSRRSSDPLDTFYLGTHEVSWLGRTDVPLFISRHRLIRQKTYPRALGRWALDSGGFTTLNSVGRWTINDVEWAAEIRRYSEEIGVPDFVAPRDWMCEPWILAKTRKTISEHQRLTIDSYLALREQRVPVIPVLQGWDLDDYLRHAEAYTKDGVDLATLPLVGLGSVCRRQSTHEAEAIIRRLNADGIRLHGFGVKINGLKRYADAVTTADSMAWSFRARRSCPLPGHEARHARCNNCMEFALLWRERLLSKMEDH